VPSSGLTSVVVVMAQGEIGDVMMVDAMRPSFSPHQQRLQLSSMDNSSSNNNNK
jgi:hypothetical protein